MSCTGLNIIPLPLGYTRMVGGTIIYQKYKQDQTPKCKNSWNTQICCVLVKYWPNVWHYSDAIMSAMASQITSITIVYSAVHSGADQRKHQSSASLAYVRGIHRGPVNSPHKWPVTRKNFPFDDVIMMTCIYWYVIANLIPGRIQVRAISEMIPSQL